MLSCKTSHRTLFCLTLRLKGGSVRITPLPLSPISILIFGPVGKSFLAYVEQLLVPTLKPGDIVIIDNLGSHKGKAVRRTIGATGASCSSCRPTVPIPISI